jgi:hypothetical protein
MSRRRHGLNINPSVLRLCVDISCIMGYLDHPFGETKQPLIINICTDSYSHYTVVLPLCSSLYM